MKHLKEFVKSVPDYRRTDKGNYKYKLEDILLLVILGRLGKCMTRPDIIRFGERNLKRFRSLGILLDGVPSEPTLCRIFKHIDDEEHKKLTGHTNKNILDCARYLSEQGIPMWIRHVLVPGITDNDEYLKRTREFIDSLDTVKKVEVLPYHTLGEYKWKELGIPYKLEGVDPPSEERVQNAKKILEFSKY